MYKELASGLMFESKYFSGPARLLAGTYYEGQGLALRLVSDDGIFKPISTISVNFPAESLRLPAHQFYCKDWSENTGMADWLELSGIAELVDLGGIQCGFECFAPLMQLTPQYAEKLRGN